MSRLIIKNIGPIREVDFKLNKINVFMGPQSSGKSTIAKIVSFCVWLDKIFSRDGLPKGEPKIDYIQKLKTYHRLTDGYFNEESQIYFSGNFVELNYNNCHPVTLSQFQYSNIDRDGEYTCTIGTRENKPIDNNSKIIYIPAERNLVSTIYNLQEYLRDRDNIQDFVVNWYEAKRKYSPNNKLNILNLGVHYYSEKEDIDRLQLQGGGDIALQIASSGLQSVVPLLTMLDYVTSGVYDEKRPISVKERDELMKKINELLEEKRNSEQNIDYSLLLDLIDAKNYRYSQVILEEPEQNLFPSTQRDLIYHLLALLNSGKEQNRDHRLTFTTHSPYVLYALNNCMMGHLVNNQLQGEEKEDYLNNKFLSETSWIDPKTVSVWEIEKGKIRTIQDKDNIISENYFDLKMTELTDEFYQMLNYYE